MVILDDYRQNKKVTCGNLWSKWYSKYPALKCASDFDDQKQYVQNMYSWNLNEDTYVTRIAQSQQ